MATAVGIPYAVVDEMTGERICPVCGVRIGGKGKAGGRRYAAHYEAAHAAEELAREAGWNPAWDPCGGGSWELIVGGKFYLLSAVDDSVFPAGPKTLDEPVVVGRYANDGEGAPAEELREYPNLTAALGDPR